MGTFELIRFSSPEELAAAGARLWLEELQADGGGSLCVALSGGRIARTFLRASAELGKSCPELFSHVHFFWGDERCVPPDHPESNYGLARACLLEPLRISPAQVHRIKGELPPEQAAAEAAGELCRLAGRTGKGSPVLDLVFLGMGEDGHVASLFPGDPLIGAPAEPVFRPVTATKPPPRRITLGFQTLVAARAIWVLASGAGKVEALRNSLSSAGLTPLARLLQARSASRIFTDIAVDV